MYGAELSYNSLVKNFPHACSHVLHDLSQNAVTLRGESTEPKPKTFLFVFIQKLPHRATDIKLNLGSHRDYFNPTDDPSRTENFKIMFEVFIL